MLIPIAAMAALVGANPASAADGNGWTCISPFANYTNGTYPDDPPAPNHLLDSLAITVTRDDATPLTATAGQRLSLRDLWLTLDFTDERVAEQMYRRTGGASYSYRGIPRGQVADTERTFSSRTDNPADAGVAYWAYNTGTNQAPAWVYPSKVSAGPPQVRTADQPENTPDFTYPAPTLSFAHRYLSHTGNSQFPLDASVAIAASNTVEGVQTADVKGYWTINIQDATPGSATNPAGYNDGPVTATVETVELQLPRLDWTPTGAGPVEFTIAPPGNMSEVWAESKGYERTGYNKPMLVRPFGSVYVRAQTEAYGASNDCIPGGISVVNTAITAGQAGLLFGDVEFDPSGAPDPGVGDPATPGFYTNQNGQQKARGVRGRFGFTFQALPAIATAPLAVPVAAPAPVPAPAPAPAPEPKAVAFASKSSMTVSKAGSVGLTLTNPNAGSVRYRLSAKTVSKYKVGKSKTKKVVNVAAGKTLTLKAGESNVRFALSSAAKSLLRQRKSVKVKLTLTPATGGRKAVTKTITLKRS
jgi:hypothetical protein